MNKKNIASLFNPNLTPNQLKLIELYEEIERNNNYQTSTLKDIYKLIEDEGSKLKRRISEVSLKVNNALFGDKKFLQETYSYDIPIDSRYFIDKGHISIKDGILTTKAKISDHKSISNLTPLNFNSRKNTDFEYKDKLLEVEKNLTYPYQELEIKIPKHITSGYLTLSFNKYENMSILDGYGREIQDKAIINEFTLPITKSISSYIIRFEDNTKKKLIISNFSITNSTFDLLSTVYTQPISINQNLREIGINTCDNYSDSNVNITYELSINNGPYRYIRPLNKHKNIDLNSILSVDDSLSYLELEDIIVSNEGRYLFSMNNTDLQDFSVIKAFKTKIGTDKGFIQDGKVTLYLNKSISIVLNNNDTITINKKQIRANSDNYVVRLNEGFNEIEVTNLLWNQTIDLLLYSVKEVSDSSITLIDKTNNSTLEKLITYSTSKDNNSIFLQVMKEDPNVTMYTDSFIPKPYYLANSLYYEKEPDSSKAYLYVKYNTRRVNYVQLRINLESVSKEIPPYISTITIRGV